jgi:hypothetical protein
MNESIKIVEYDEFHNQLEILRDTANFLPDVSTDEGYEKSKRVSLDISPILTKLEKVRKEKKSYFLEGGKQVDRQAKDIKALIEEIQLPHKLAYKEIDDAKKEREAKRVAEIQERITIIRELPESMRDSSSDEIMAAKQDLEANQCLDFYEFTQDALMLRNNVQSELGVLYTRRLKEEKDAEELAVLKKEKEERERIEREAEIRAEAKEELREEVIEEVKQEIVADPSIGGIQQTSKGVVWSDERISSRRTEAKVSLMELGLCEDMARKIVLAIHNNQIDNVAICYKDKENMGLQSLA